MFALHWMPCTLLVGIAYPWLTGGAIAKCASCTSMATATRPTEAPNIILELEDNLISVTIHVTSVRIAPARFCMCMWSFMQHLYIRKTFHGRVFRQNRKLGSSQGHSSVKQRDSPQSYDWFFLSYPLSFIFVTLAYLAHRRKGGTRIDCAVACPFGATTRQAHQERPQVIIRVHPILGTRTLPRLHALTAAARFGSPRSGGKCFHYLCHQYMYSGAPGYRLLQARGFLKCMALEECAACS